MKLKAVRFVQSSRGYFTNEVAAFPPDQAKQLIAAGQAVAYEPDNGDPTPDKQVVVTHQPDREVGPQDGPEKGTAPIETPAEPQKKTTITPVKPQKKNRIRNRQVNTATA